MKHVLHADHLRINRRTLLKLGGGALLSACLPSSLLARTNSRKILVHVLLNGGPDWKHVIVPPFSSNPGSYGNAYWTARKNVHTGRFSRPASMELRYQNDYTELTDRRHGKFGLLKHAGWLIDEYKKGHVAIINNVIHSTNRNHSWSLIITQSGDLSARESAADRDGWGGRLAAALGNRIVSITPEVRLFCHPPADASQNNIFSAHDSRNAGIYVPTITYQKEEKQGLHPERYNSHRAKMHRAMEHYYRLKSSAESPGLYQKFFEHEQSLRQISLQVQSRLLQIPDYFEGVPAGGGKERNAELQKFRFPDTYVGGNFGRQLRSLYDCIQLQDLLDFNVASLEMGGFDTHKLQQDYLEPKINQIFGNSIIGTNNKNSSTQGGLKTLLELLPAERRADLVFMFTGDFGRQLKANGGMGTDHGRANSIVLVGESVRGGMYGDPFPQNEILRFEQDNQDAEGRTGLEQVYSAVSDWIGGVGSTVFPNRTKAPEEERGLLNQLFS